MADEVETLGREFPKMIYKDGKLSQDPADYRVVNDEDEEVEALEAGFCRHDVTAKAKAKAARADAKAPKVKGK